ncbi:hypothetical protein [Solicola gregarius]|uniref:Uncharacterized protein n=1 Tax=Solicola gregarius TaxID=2908642 RepID=A0AA46YKN3_9ACTN|nr:hypothetical protein [Solicola gregarius]UYM05682.1 hypothetical protein L0C25_00965 [Solicola gregarius]
MRAGDLAKLGYADDWCPDIDYAPEPVYDADGSLLEIDFVDRRFQIIEMLGGSRGHQSRMYEEATATDLPIDEIVSKHGSIGQQRRFRQLRAEGLI